MYGDTRMIRKLARTMEEQGSAIRRDADALEAAAWEVVWDGLAARAMRDRVTDHATALRRTADGHDAAADALRHHADEVDRLKQRIAEIAARVAALVDGARERLADLAARAADAARRVVGDPVDELLDRFEPPPVGHMEWLQVPDQLPGVAA
jgi:hypothetical protein